MIHWELMGWNFRMIFSGERTQVFMVKSIPGGGKMGEMFLYEAKYRYSPHDHGDDPEFYITIDPGDKLEVLEENMEKGPERPDSWLRGSNITKNTHGMFPGPYVTFLGVKSELDKPPDLPPMPPNVPKKVPSQKSLDGNGQSSEDYSKY